MIKLSRKSLVMTIASALAMGAACCYGAEAAHWTYAGATGPAKWSALDKGFGLCKTGTAQAPVDIPDADARKGDLPALLFNYKPSPLKIVDNGHTVQVNYEPGSFVSVAGKRYELVEFHFHKPGEHKVDGKGHEMEAQMVHKGPDGSLSVIAVPLDAGKENRLIKTLWDNLPQDKGKERVVDAVKINALDLLPRDKGYYTFAGSLTIPPCTESVTWFVLKTPVQISADEIARFGRVYPMNARPIQPRNDRDIQGTR